MRAARLVPFAALGLALALFARPHNPKEVAVGKAPKVVLVIHGGAGVLTDKEMRDEKLTRRQYEEALTAALAAGAKAYRRPGSTAVDVVEAAIRSMEDCALFNAGHGAVLDNDGRASLDASIMEGRMAVGKGQASEGKRDPRKRAGAVAAVGHVKNPISAARAVMEMKDGRHVLLVGEGAEWFALSGENRRRYHIERVSNVYFWTDRRLRDVRKEVAAERRQARAPRARPDRRLGTVGAVARVKGTLAAGTSTGGLTNKMHGRLGDSPLIGAGTYADDRACGVSCTGTGEVFIRHAVAHDVVARMLYRNDPVGKAADEVIAELPDEKEGVGGLIALDNRGIPAFAMSKESVGMYRGYLTEGGEIRVGLFRGEALRAAKETPGAGQ